MNPIKAKLWYPDKRIPFAWSERWLTSSHVPSLKRALIKWICSLHWQEQIGPLFLYLMNHKCQLWLWSKLLRLIHFVVSKWHPLWFLLACLGAGDPSHQGNGPTESIKCQFNEMHSLYTYGHWVFLIRVYQEWYSTNTLAIKDNHVWTMYNLWLLLLVWFLWAPLTRKWCRVGMDYSKTNVLFALIAVILSLSVGISSNIRIIKNKTVQLKT